ncbi:TP8L3 protein, partial [Polypterus senegalus]
MTGHGNSHMKSVLSPQANLTSKSGKENPKQTTCKQARRHTQRASGLCGVSTNDCKGPEIFNSKSLAIQAQKKIVSKMATKVMANMLIDDTSSEILDELYKVSQKYTKNKKEAHKIMKNVIKIALKIGILYRNNQFNQDELETVEKFKKKMNQTAMTVVSFYEVDYTFDRHILSGLLNECKDLLHELVEHHLTAKSHGRINHVFNHFADAQFLSVLYSPSGEYRLFLKKICDGINKLLDEGVL